MSPGQSKQLTGYLNNNLGEVLFGYARQAAERTEFARSFGAYGERLQELLDNAKRAGATDKQIQQAKDFVAGAQGRYGRESKEALANLAEHLPIPEAWKTRMHEGGNVAPAVQAAMGAITTIHNFRLLGLAAFTASADFAGVATRASSPLEMFKGVRATFAELGRTGDQPGIRNLGETLGLLDAMSAYDSVSVRYLGAQETRLQRKVNDALFTYNGVKYLMDFARRAAIVAAKQSMKRHKEHPTRTTEQFLNELGVFPDDITIDGSGDVVVLTEEQRAKATPQQRAADDRVRTAIHRFVSQSVVKPNAATKTFYMNDPNFALITYLKPFIWAMHENVTSRLTKSLGGGDVAPIVVAYATYTGLMAASEWLRELVQHGPSGNPRRANWTLSNYADHGLTKAGLTGYWSLIGDAQKDRRFGGIGIEPLAGVTAGLAIKTAQGRASLTELAPLQNVWKNW
jgi:hypothetical protein